MYAGADIIETTLLEDYPDAFVQLLLDRTTRENIFWATRDYEQLGEGYKYHNYIMPERITGDYGCVIMPRVKKDELLQQSRIREKAEVFTPSWVCNAQNNLIDDAWFGRSQVFNREVQHPDGSRGWEVNPEPVSFPEGKSWQQYIREPRLEIACGEAPYVTSRYDTVTGAFIPIEQRIGFLDRKLRVADENTEHSGTWLKAAQAAYMSSYAYEWQGDNLLLAREAMLATFIENYEMKFGRKPLKRSIDYIAYIISWNVWQMDGMKGVVPDSCTSRVKKVTDLFNKIKTQTLPCEGCQNQDIHKHNGTYCIIKDWKKRNLKTRRKGRPLKFIDLIK